MIEDDQFHQQVRQLGEEDDLEQAIDNDNQYSDQNLKSKILFAIQGLGSIKTIKKDGRQIEAYIKGDYCQQSIKDLVKNIRKDVPQNPKVSLILSQYNIIESDLIKILVLHAEDKKLSFWLLALLSYLTAKPSDSLLQIEKQILNKALQEYKRTFMRNEGITYLILHISDYVKTPIQKRQKAHIQLMQFIIILIRNLLQVKSEQVGSDQLHSHFLLAMFKQEMISPLFYLLQMEKGELMQKIQVPLLQIFYHVFTCFDPAVLYETKTIANLRQQAQKFSNKKSEPVRHSRFMPNFLQANQSGVSRVVHTLEKKQQPLIGQRKVPNRVADLKKVKQIQREYIQQNFLQMMVDVQGDGKKRAMRQLVFQYAKQLVQVQFQHLSKLVFDNIYKENAKVSKQNVIQYLLLCSWQLQMTRAKYQKGQMMAKTPQQKGAVQFDFAQILCIMQTGHFELIYKLLFRQATREKKKDFDINMFNAALTLFSNYLAVIQDISVSFNMSDRKNANALMANMFRHDIARIFKIGFHRISHQKILSSLILVVHKFFKLLSEYSRGKVLTIQTNKMLKSKRNKRKQREQEEQKQMQQFISEDSDESNNSDSYNENEDGKPKEKTKKKEATKNLKQQQQQIRFQQRKYNQMTQFAIIADYEVISKYLIFLKGDRFLTNNKNLNVAIFFYIERIVSLLKGQWLFYQAETLIIFKQIISSAQFARQYTKSRDVVKQICASFIKLLRNNRLALVQSLFRYNNLQIKQQILKNYAQYDTEDQHNEVDRQYF